MNSAIDFCCQISMEKDCGALTHTLASSTCALMMRLAFVTLLAGCATTNNQADFTTLFSKDGVPEGWTVRAWDDVNKPAPTGVVWRVTNGALHGSEPRGTWLVS